MNTLFFVLKILMLSLSFLGYYRFLRFRYDLKQEFCPAIILSATGCLLFLFGIVNLLVPCANGLLATGFILLAYTFVRYDNKSIKTLFHNSTSDITIGLLFFFALAVFIIIRLQDAHFYDCDNFNHWGLIVKNLYYDNCFPDDSDPIIRFQTYPVGSATLIWYYLRFFDYSEDIALIVQDLFMMSCGISLFALIKKEKRLGIKIVSSILALMGTLSLFSCNKDLANGPFELLVDQMLASIAVAAIIIIDYYKADWKKALWSVLPLLTFEIAIKTSGIFFSLAIAIVLAYRIIKTNGRRKAILPVSVLILTPIVLRKLWDLRVKLVFANSSTSIHSTSIDNYRIIMAGKTSEDIKTITTLFLGEALSFNNYIVSFVIILTILYFLFEYKKENRYHIKNSTIYIIVLYVAYQIGLYCMYIFSMPVYEALCMPCYYRYILPIELLIMGIIIEIIINIMTNENFTLGKKFLNYSGIALCCFILVFYAITNAIFLFVPRKTEVRIHNANYMRAVFSKYDLPQDQNVSYLIYISDLNDEEDYSEFTDYQWHFATYDLYSAKLNTLRQSQLADFEHDKLVSYDYIIIAIPDNEIVDYLASNEIPYQECIDVNTISDI